MGSLGEEHGVVAAGPASASLIAARAWRGRKPIVPLGRLFLAGGLRWQPGGVQSVSDFTSRFGGSELLTRS